jgi:hypothetical protein
MQIEMSCPCKSAGINQLNQPTRIDIFYSKIGAGEPVLIERFSAVASIRFYQRELGQLSNYNRKLILL